MQFVFIWILTEQYYIYIYHVKFTTRLVIFFSCLINELVGELACELVSRQKL